MTRLLLIGQETTQNITCWVLSIIKLILTWNVSITFFCIDMKGVSLSSDFLLNRSVFFFLVGPIFWLKVTDKSTYLWLSVFNVVKYSIVWLRVFLTARVIQEMCLCGSDWPQMVSSPPCCHHLKIGYVNMACSQLAGQTSSKTAHSRLHHRAGSAEDNRRISLLSPC